MDEPPEGFLSGPADAGGFLDEPIDNEPIAEPMTSGSEPGLQEGPYSHTEAFAEEMGMPARPSNGPENAGGFLDEPTNNEAMTAEPMASGPTPGLHEGPFSFTEAFAEEMGMTSGPSDSVLMPPPPRQEAQSMVSQPNQAGVGQGIDGGPQYGNSLNQVPGSDYYAAHGVSGSLLQEPANPHNFEASAPR